jgi:hypothetical protein
MLERIILQGVSSGSRGTIDVRSKHRPEIEGASGSRIKTIMMRKKQIEVSARAAGSSPVTETMGVELSLHPA